MHGPSRVKFEDLGTNPETGKQRRRYVGLMDEEEYIKAIMAWNGAVDDPSDVADLPDLDEGSQYVAPWGVGL